MSSSPQDSATQQASSAAAQQASATQAANAATAQTNANNMSTSLYGTYDPTTNSYTGGSESNFLNPANLTQTGLSGSYLNAYNNAANGVANNTQNSVGTTMQNLASRGLGATPTGFGADQERQAYQTEAGQLGTLYSGAAGQQLTDATNNYWQATNGLNGAANTNQASATANNAGAAGTNTSLYGTASQQVASPWATALGSVAGAAGAIGAAGVTKCWIAEAIYGKDSPLTELARTWLNGPFSATFFGCIIMWLYGAIGRQVAWCVRRSNFLKRAFEPLFRMVHQRAFDDIQIALMGVA